MPRETGDDRRMFGRAAALLLVGCYGAHPAPGAPCTAVDHLCPEPLVCSAGLCQDHASMPDAALDAVACLPIADGDGILTAPEIATPTLDGNLTDWPTCFITIAAGTNPTRDLGANGMFPSGRFSIAHDATHIYVAAEVMGVAPLGDQPPPAIYQNNSVSFYLDGDGSFTTETYGADGDQIVIDHAGQVQAFRSGQLVTPPNISSAARAVDSMFTIEMAVQASTFGLVAFGPMIGFDIGLEGGDGTTQTSEVLWTESCGPPACGCATAGVAAPYCDEREFGVAKLAP
jgi:hypothetical protein